MKISRSFSGSSSPGSLLLGFLDVISCGFAAALVLGLILSIVQPPEAGVGAQDKPFRYFEFAITDAAGAAPDDRPYVTPVILYRASGQAEERRIPLILVDRRWNPDQSAPQVTFIGAAAIENRVLVAGPDTGNVSTVFGVLVSDLAKDADVDVQLIYSSRTKRKFATAGAATAPITITRTVFGGASDGKPQPNNSLSLGEMTSFPAAIQK